MSLEALGGKGGPLERGGVSEEELEPRSGCPDLLSRYLEEAMKTGRL